MLGFSETLKQSPRREMPWRQIGADGTIEPYIVLVSEIMLQQTQVGRVLPKFEAFVRQFPSVSELARASLADVLRAWSGLGYNRRAKYLRQAAQMIVRDFGGRFPTTVQELSKLPGVGVNTAGAIIAYAYNQPTVFIETNIRTVYIHHFFHDQNDIPDSAILEKLQQTLDREHPREFYWALMDWGTELKRQQGNLSRRSRHYTKQTTFKGSLRQLRGQVLRELTASSKSQAVLQATINDERLADVLENLQVEGLITKKKQHYYLG